MLIKYSRWMTLIGGILAFFSFALPWDNELSGAELANTGEGTLVTIAIIVAIGLFLISISLLNRNTSWQFASIVVALIISGILLFLFILFADVLIGSRYETAISRINAIAILFVLALSLFGVSIYVSNRFVFKTFWRIGLALVLGSIGVLSIISLIYASINSGINFIIIDFIGAVTIIGVSIFVLIWQPSWKSISTFLILISSSVGLCCFLVLFVSDSLHLKFEGDFLFRPRYGAFLTAIGYILAIIGAFGSRETNNSAEVLDTTLEVDPYPAEEEE